MSNHHPQRCRLLQPAGQAKASFVDMKNCSNKMAWLKNAVIYFLRVAHSKCFFNRPRQSQYPVTSLLRKAIKSSTSGGELTTVRIFLHLRKPLIDLESESKRQRGQALTFHTKIVITKIMCSSQSVHASEFHGTLTTV